MKLEKEVQLISGAIDKAFKSGVYGVSEASQVLACLGALQAEHYSKETKQAAGEPAPMEIVKEEEVPEKKK
jgi:hypothetical protein